jgi:hypothetical protein
MHVFILIGGTKQAESGQFHLMSTCGGGCIRRTAASCPVLSRVCSKYSVGMYHPVRTVVAALHLHIVTQYGRVGWSGLVFGPEKLKRRLEGAPSPGLRCHPACQGSPIQGPDLPCHCPTFHGAGLTNPRRQVKDPSVGCGEQKLRFCRRDCTPPKEDATPLTN